MSAVDFYITGFQDRWLKTFITLELTTEYSIGLFDVL